MQSKYHTLPADRKVQCNICHKMTDVYTMVNAGMVIGWLNVCKPCDQRHRDGVK